MQSNSFLFFFIPCRDFLPLVVLSLVVLSLVVLSLVVYSLVVVVTMLIVVVIVLELISNGIELIKWTKCNKTAIIHFELCLFIFLYLFIFKKIVTNYFITEQCFPPFLYPLPWLSLCCCFRWWYFRWWWYLLCHSKW